MVSKRLNILMYPAFVILFISLGLFLIYTFNKTEHRPADISTSIHSNQLIVVIDPGHGGEDGGTVGTNGCLEKDINLSMAKKLKNILSAMGINSVLTRDTDVLLYDKNSDYQGQKKRQDMQKRLDIARSYENTIFISIHQNAFPQNKYQGFQVYFSQNSTSSFTLGKTIEQAVKSTLQPNNSRVAKPSNGSIFLLDKLYCPALLLECGFLSNPDECQQLCNEDYQRELCTVIAFSIVNYIQKTGVSYLEDTPYLFNYQSA